MNKTNKAKVAYYRKLYLAFLMSTKKYGFKTLVEESGMGTGTVQTTLNSLDSVGIFYTFIRTGLSNRNGHYEITDWGDHNKAWIKDNVEMIKSVIDQGP